MRIELRCNAVTQFASQINQIESDITQTINNLKNRRKEVDNVNGGHNNATRNASNNLAIRINSEIKKRQKAERVEKQISAFLNDTIAIDKSVAGIMKSNQKHFFDQYSWLKSGIDILGLIEDCKNWVKNAFKTAVEKVLSAWNAVCDWVSEHWAIIGTIGLIIGLVCAILVAPLTLVGILAAIGKVLVGMLASMAISVAIEEIIALLTGGDPWEAFQTGLKDGYAWGGITVAITGIFKIGKILSHIKEIKRTFVYSRESIANLSLENGSSTAIEHIFLGDSAKKTGCHVRSVEGAYGKVIEGTETYFKNGVTDAKIAINGKPKKYKSTFFPEDWSPKETWRNINKAFQNKVFDGNRGYIGTYKDIQVKFYLDDTGKFNTAFPFMSKDAITISKPLPKMEIPDSIIKRMIYNFYK